MKIRFRRVLALALVTGILVAGILGYAIVSYAINEQPSTQPFQGWIAVLLNIGPEYPYHAHKVELMASLDSTDPDRPLTYTLSACGKGAIVGDLLLGGDARLNNPEFLFPVRTSFKSTDLWLWGHEGELPRDLGPIQYIHFDYDDIGRCDRYPTPVEDEPFGYARVIQVRGASLASIAHRPRVLFWDVPRVSQTWPLLGKIPIRDSELYDLADFQSYYPDHYLSVDGGPLKESFSLDVARPNPATTGRIFLRSTRPFSGTVRMTNTAELAWWQQAQVLAGILLAISGSILASLIYRWAWEGQRNPCSHAAPTPMPTNRSIATDIRVGPCRSDRGVNGARQRRGPRHFMVGFIVGLAVVEIVRRRRSFH
jgi:hypothetical protein